MSSNRKRYFIVGTGNRAMLYIDALARDFRSSSELVGFCDISLARMEWHNNRLEKTLSHSRVPACLPDQFDAMLAETRADAVIVLSMDSTHHKYIIRAMELGCDVISEKPMTTDAAKAREIFDAIERTGRKVRLTFNMRYVPAVTKVCELIREGAIGTPTAVDFSYLLDTSHGADYFRRWHREKDKSGGLLVHKSTHHFDMVNWWVNSFPKTVFAMGGLRFYGRENAVSRGDQHLTQYARYTGQAAAANDPFSLQLDSDPENKGLYLDAERDNCYVRDRNVFGDHITSEDTMAVMARYRNGVVLNYSLVCYSPREGWNAGITGTKGRIEISARYNSHIIEDSADGMPASIQPQDQEYQITVLPMFGRPYSVEIPTLTGSHGGSDGLMFAQLLEATPSTPDPYSRCANHIDGAASILLGFSANESMRTGQPVDCDNLLRLPVND